MLFKLLQVHGGQVGPVDPDPAPPPLPGGASEIVRFFMHVPQWLQIGGMVLGALLGLVAVVFLWRRRKEVPGWLSAGWGWLGALPTAVKALGVAVIVAGVALGSVAGYQVYDFVEYDNRFCTGCHLMADAYVSFDESAHTELNCKDCHAQPKTESMRQLYLWVLDRPEEVGPHSPVPNARCSSCHIDEDSDRWPQIAASLGHKVHFESDDPELGELMCVTCHGVSVHQFTPAEATCGECHEAESKVVLGRMAGETELHCVACHDFLGDAPATLPGLPEGFALMPDRPQCQACHEMAGLLEEAEFDEDPHGAVCGACHNPHTQDIPGAAVETCIGCHEGADTITVFHTGTHAPAFPNCTSCHTAHLWVVDGTDCLSCHESVMQEPRSAWNGRGSSPGLGILAALRDGAPNGRHGDVGYGSGGTTVGFALTPLRDDGGPMAPDRDPSFPALLMIHGVGNLTAHPYLDAEHADIAGDTLPRPLLHRQHEAVACTECHGRAGEHGVITVRTPWQCAQCHHDPARGYDCADCHPTQAIAPVRNVATTMNLTVWDESRSRSLPFEHDTHGEFTCQECHTGPVLLAVQKGCADCHDDHHRPGAECNQCHLPTEPGVHGLEVHLTCTSSGCHAGTAGERPTLTRSMCLTCHQEQLDHEPGLDCQKCHMVPDEVPVRRGAWSVEPRDGRRAP
jgi:hypothetical protein